ncbi:MAG: hypothetical protein J7578_01880 [Chitinophagaceae bacterium]|nr:hypothetical protein [Chitinophagaceae bacterium]
MYTHLNRIPGLELFTVGSGKYMVKNLEGPITLACWSGFQSRQGAYDAPGIMHPSDGHARITLGGDMISTDPDVQPFHINAYNYLMEFQHPIQEQILHALTRVYGNLKEMYGASMPDLVDIQQFRKLIGLSAVHLLNVSKDDIAYVGYEFGCTWDEEYGLGVMTHKDRIIEIGDASTAFLTWIADKDRDPDSDESDSIFCTLQETEINHSEKKPWWKFW